MHIARACALALDGHCEGDLWFLAHVGAISFFFFFKLGNNLLLLYFGCDILADHSCFLDFCSLFDASCMLVCVCVHVCACVCTEI